MSRNSSRTRVQKSQQGPSVNVVPPQLTQKTNFVVPTEFVTLPSRGQSYKEGSTLHGVTEVEIKHMTAKEEDLITNQDYIARGIVFDKVIDSILVDKTMKASQFLDPDKMAILIAARKSGYGNQYATDGTCDHCGQNCTFTFNLQEVLDNTVNQEDPWLPDFAFHNKETGIVSVDLPISEITVEIKILDMEDRKYLEDLKKQREKLNLEFIQTVENLRRSIVQVQGDTSPDMISNFLDFIPARDSRILKGIQARLQPKINLSQEVECSSCGAGNEREVPLTGGFFWSEF